MQVEEIFDYLQLSGSQFEVVFQTEDGEIFGGDFFSSVDVDVGKSFFEIRVGIGVGVGDQFLGKGCGFCGVFDGLGQEAVEGEGALVVFPEHCFEV